MKQAIKTYLEEAIKTDEALSKVYDETKLDKCISYITDQARKELHGKNGAIADDVVFHWARDFYFGDLNTDTEAKAEPEEQIEEKQDAGDINAPTDTPAEKKLVIQEVIQDEPKGTITMAEVDAIRGKKKPAKKQKEEPVDDGQLMFDFGA